MYTLRIIEETRDDVKQPFEQVIENFELGDSYSRVKRGTKEFKKIIDELYPESVEGQIESLILGENEKMFFIEKNNENRVYSYFIMGDSGKTFEKL